MHTQVDVLYHGGTKTYRFNWKKGTPPQNNDALRAELERLEYSLVYRTYGATSLVVDLGPEVNLDEVLEVFRTFGYDTTGIVIEH